MFTENLAEQLCSSILDNKISLKNLIGSLKNYPHIAQLLNNRYLKVPMIFSDSAFFPVQHNVVAPANHPKFGVNNDLTKYQQQAFIQIPCVHYLLFQFHSDMESLIEFFDIQPFKASYLHLNEQQHLLLGFNLYNLLGLKLNEDNILNSYIRVNNKEEFMNFYVEQKNNNNSQSVDCSNFFTLFDFNLTIDDLLYDNDKIINKKRKLTVCLLDKEIVCTFKNLNELDNEERIVVDNLIKYKIDKQNINLKFDTEQLLNFIVLKNYFINQEEYYHFFVNLLHYNPILFTSEIMGLLCLHNFELHEIIIENYKDQNNSFVHDVSFSLNQENFIQKYSSTIQDIVNLNNQLSSNEQDIKKILEQLQTHIDIILNDNGISYLSEHIEDSITFEHILCKYIPSVLSNYLSIPSHLRIKEDLQFLSLTLKQLNSIEKELEKIELAVMSEDLCKMKIYGKFLDTRLGNNSPDIFTLE